MTTLVFTRQLYRKILTAYKYIFSGDNAVCRTTIKTKSHEEPLRISHTTLLEDSSEFERSKYTPRARPGASAVGITKKIERWC